MRTARFGAAVAALCLTGAMIPGRAESRAGVDRPPPAHTGGFGEPTCHACHYQDDLNAGDGTLTVDGLPAEYMPGGTYRLVVTLSQPGLGAGGFEMSARFDDGSQAGSFPLAAAAPAAPAVDVTVLDDVLYAHHTYAGTRRSAPDTARWSIVWTAPATEGDVMFHVAANAADDDESPLGDMIYTTTLHTTARD